jgi:hypothetical protein
MLFIHRNIKRFTETNTTVIKVPEFHICIPSNLLETVQKARFVTETIQIAILEYTLDIVNHDIHTLTRMSRALEEIVGRNRNGLFTIRSYISDLLRE